MAPNAPQSPRDGNASTSCRWNEASGGGGIGPNDQRSQQRRERVARRRERRNRPNYFLKSATSPPSTKPSIPRSLVSRRFERLPSPETISTYAHEQGLTRRKLLLDQLFIDMSQGRKRGVEFRI